MLLWELREVQIWERHMREARWRRRWDTNTRELLQHLWRKRTGREREGLRGLGIGVKPPQVQTRVRYRYRLERRRSGVLRVCRWRINGSRAIWRLRWIVSVSETCAIWLRWRILIRLRHDCEVSRVPNRKESSTTSSHRLSDEGKKQKA
jgi:hypothetical protein